MNTLNQFSLGFVIVLCLFGGCRNTPAQKVLEPETGSVLPVNTAAAALTLPSPSPSPAAGISGFAYPRQVDPSRRYLFYLHGKIVEDQGIPAASPDFGEYHYLAILERLRSFGFEVISEQRLKDTDSGTYARRVAGQVERLGQAGIPSKDISVVGASKGAGIAILTSNLLPDEEINYVILAICAPETVEALIQNSTTLHGNVLSIYDRSDEFAGSCEKLFEQSEGKGLASHDEIVLDLDLGHGLVYQPLDDWILPAVAWADGER